MSGGDKRSIAVFASFVGVIVVTAATRFAYADDASGEAAAQTLFDQARALMNQKDYAHACPKFAASQKEDPAPGTLLNLAHCYEKNGQTASAWASYKDAASVAQASGRKDWAKQADDGAAALAPKLSRLTVHAPTPAAGTVVKRDGKPMSNEELDLALPLDPGAHTVDVTAPGKAPFHADVTLGAEADAKVVVVPLLADAVASVPPPPASTTAAPSAMPPSSAPPDSASSGSRLRTAGFVVGGVGVAGLVVGVAAALASHSKNSDATDICPNSGPCSSMTAVDDASRAHSDANLATVGFIAGGALVAGGLAMIFFAPKSDGASSASELHFTPWIDAPRAGSVGGAGFALGGSFR